MVAIPGPSVMPERVLAAFRLPMPNIYEGELLDVADEVFARLPAIADTAGHAFLSIGNGHSGWQMAAANTLSRGDKVLVLESGRFPAVWGLFLERSGIEVETLPATPRSPVDPEAVAARLAAGPTDEFAAVLAVHVDTAISVRNDIEAIGRSIAASGSSALFVVDCIASMACDEFHMDAWGVDITIAASQKGLMTPPGLGIVWANERAIERGRNADLRDGYFDWQARLEGEQIYQQFSGTPPVSHLFALREALRMIDEETLAVRWQRHRVLGDAVRSAVLTWETPGGVELMIRERGAQADCVTTVLTPHVDALTLASVCENTAGLTIGLGVMDHTGSFRIGHMGHVNPPALLGALGTIEAGLRVVGAPLGGSGVASAAEVIAEAMATHPRA